jgi:hypothetical protein
MATLRLTGNVTLKKFAPGSKSEHDAVFLETAQGDYKLRRVGGNPFRDNELDQLVGKKISASGSITDYLFTIDHYEIIG